MKLGVMLAAALALAGVLRVASIYTVAVNWDEFALLDRARLTLETGQLVSGGRPGLGVLVLLPFVEGCADEIEAVRHARLLWLGFTAAFLFGVGVLARQLRGDPWLAVGLLALVPAFLDWSIQVRTDQIALAAGVWGGVALLASRRRMGWAPVSGLLFGVGMLASQKVVYVGALVAVLALARVELRRDAPRAALALVVFGSVLAGWEALMAWAFAVPAIHASQDVVSTDSVSRAMGHFDFYRKTLGFQQYREMLPTLVPHAALLAALVAATWRRKELGLLLPWGVLAVGLGVALFHAGAFFYFWMTLGLFPALAFAIAKEEVLPQGRARRFALPVLWAALAIPGVLQMGFLLQDTQAVQRESLAFVHRNFGADDAGFHPERSPFCWQGEQPLSRYFSMAIYRDFGTTEEEEKDRRLGHMMATFRERPVKFIVQSFRLNQFPVELRRFWAENYQPYRGSVFVAGRRLEGRQSEFEVFVPGAYRWFGKDAVQIDERELAPGDVVQLASGDHTAELGENGPGGVLVLALSEPPGPSPLRFYKAY